jgi:hypothetical protein
MSQEGGQKREMRSSIICILLNEVIRMMMMRLAGHVARNFISKPKEKIPI